MIHALRYIQALSHWWIVFLTVLLLGIGVWLIVQSNPRIDDSNREFLQGKYLIKVVKTESGADLTISKDGYTLFNEYAEGDFFFGRDLDDPRISLIPNVTSIGESELVIRKWNGSAHGDSDYIVLRLAKTVQEVARIKGVSLGHFTDIDGNGTLEFVGYDRTFEYWHGVSYSDSPFPRIVLVYQGGSFRYVASLNRILEPNEQELETIREHQQRNPAWNEGYPPSDLARIVVDFVYGGHSSIGWELIDKIWPENLPGRDAYKNDIRETLARSPYWNDIQREFDLSRK